MKIYAQIINNTINLIGGADVGLPLSKQFSEENPDILCIDITLLKPMPNVGDYYKDGIFYTQEEFYALYPPDISPPVVSEYSTQDIQAALVSLQQMSLMQSLGVKIPVEQQAEMEVKALANIDIPVADGEFKTGVRAEKDSIVTYKGTTYKCIQPHITQSDWTPDKTPALWVVVQSEPEDGEILPWVAGEAVKVGDKRTYKGKTYECIQAHTTQAGWEPSGLPALWKLI